GVSEEAVDRHLDFRLALKTLRHLDPRALWRFKREFRTLHDLHHPNLVRIDELVEHQGQWFFTMELVPAVNFHTYVRGAPTPLHRDDTWAARPSAKRATDEIPRPPTLP